MPKNMKNLNVVFTIHHLEAAESLFPFIYDVIAIWLNNIFDPEQNVYFEDVSAYVESDFDSIVSAVTNRYDDQEISMAISEQHIYNLIRSAIEVIQFDLDIIQRQLRDNLLESWMVDDTRRMSKDSIMVILRRDDTVRAPFQVGAIGNMSIRRGCVPGKDLLTVPPSEPATWGPDIDVCFMYQSPSIPLEVSKMSGLNNGIQDMLSHDRYMSELAANNKFFNNVAALHKEARNDN